MCPLPRLLRELELLTLEESLLGEGASLLGLCRRELTGSSHPLRFPKVMRALRMWKMGISAGKEGKSREGSWVHHLNREQRHHRPLPPTNLDGEAGREAQGDEVPQLGEESVAYCHEVNDGGDLLAEGQRMVLTQPQLCLEPGGDRCWTGEPCLLPSRGLCSSRGSETGRGSPVCSFPTHFCVLVVSSMGRPMSRLPSSKLGLKYSSGVMAVGLAWLSVCVISVCGTAQRGEGEVPNCRATPSNLETLTPLLGPTCCSAMPRKDCRGVLLPVERRG